MAADHTPGPWHFFPQKGYFPRVYIGGDIPEVAEIVGHYISVNACYPGAEMGTHEANARLIAAAPDLLAALERLVGWFDDADDEAIIVEARAAIAKARGADE